MNWREVLSFEPEPEPVVFKEGDKVLVMAKPRLLKEWAIDGWLSGQEVTIEKVEGCCITIEIDTQRFPGAIPTWSIPKELASKFLQKVTP
jgi:hypothetical protein